MLCPLCRKRPAKRACPALRHDICPVCCATKQRGEIACPDDCRYLEGALKHPAASVKRQLDLDISALMTTLGRLNEQQLHLFFLIQTLILNHKPNGLARLVDGDVALAAGALASSLEIASRGLIYDETTPSLVAEGLRRELKPLVEEVIKDGGSRAERETAQVLRGIERGGKHELAAIGAEDTSYLALVARVLRQRGPTAPEPPKPLIITP